MTRLSIDELETLTPDQLGRLLCDEIQKASPDVMCIQDLLTVGCPINYRDREGWTALHHATRWGSLEVVKFLISKGAELDVRDNWGQTALHVATKDKYLWVLQSLESQRVLAYGMEIDSRIPFHHVVTDERIDVVKFLLSKGAQVDIRDNGDRTAWDLTSEEIRKAFPELKPWLG